MTDKSTIRRLPLYDVLAQKLTQRVNQGTISITPEFKSKLKNILSSLSINNRIQVTLLLIDFYFINNPESNPFAQCQKTSSRTFVNLPYDIRLNSAGKGFSFDLELLPIQLQALLGIYCGL